MKTLENSFKFALLVALILVSPVVALAGNDKVILTIKSVDLGTVEYSLDDLNKLPVTQFETATLWTDGTQTFQGVSLSTLLEEIGVAEGTVLATAVNDYAVEIPITEISDGAPIIAYKLNNRPMSLREKGPLWVVYPYDNDVKYQTETIYSRSIWQLDRIEIK